MTGKKTLYLVDDDEAIRHSASFMLRHAGFVVKTYEDGATFLKQLDADERGCVLLDLRMPNMDGLAVQQKLIERGVDLPVIILTGHGDVPIAVQAMKAGAVDFVQKPYEKQTLLVAIEGAFEQMDEEVTQAGRVREAKARLAALTKREREVLERLVHGSTNKAIAEELGISPRTIEIHRANLMMKLEADSLSSALRVAFFAGLGNEA
ncbi:MAG: response regulator [Henriciella sp.]|nr:response regulator [Henriciella sp.]